MTSNSKLIDELNTRLPPNYCECELPRGELARQIADIADKYGDGIPIEEIKEYTKDEHLDKWDTICSCDVGNVVAISRYIKNDWYMATIKNVATDPSHRGKKLGTIVANRSIKKAKDSGVMVLSADITVSNTHSQNIFKHAGFEKVSTFCGGKGFPPADVEHYIIYPAEVDKDGNCI